MLRSNYSLEVLWIVHRFQLYAFESCSLSSLVFLQNNMGSINVNVHCLTTFFVLGWGLGSILSIFRTQHCFGAILQLWCDVLRLCSVSYSWVKPFDNLDMNQHKYLFPGVVLVDSSTLFSLNGKYRLVTERVLSERTKTGVVTWLRVTWPEGDLVLMLHFWMVWIFVLYRKMTELQVIFDLLASNDICSYHSGAWVK